MKTKYRVLFALLPVVLIFDQITKLAVASKFRFSESIPIVEGIFNFTYVRNTGAAFGLLHNAQESFRVPFFVVVPLISLIAIGYVFRRLADSDVRLSSALSCVVGGALGNLIDRLHWGYVIDFLDFHWKYDYHFPAFNIADMAICTGVVALMLDLLQNKHENPSEDANVSAAL
ncbi:MAG: signal peptidase II [Oligoflexia bacterium]|nr:signal peptidase II [Oligoflexia bacterium]